MVFVSFSFFFFFLSSYCSQYYVNNRLALTHAQHEMFPSRDEIERSACLMSEIIKAKLDDDDDDDDDDGDDDDGEGDEHDNDDDEADIDQQMKRAKERKEMRTTPGTALATN